MTNIEKFYIRLGSRITKVTYRGNVKVTETVVIYRPEEYMICNNYDNVNNFIEFLKATHVRTSLLSGYVDVGVLFTEIIDYCSYMSDSPPLRMP